MADREYIGCIHVHTAFSDGACPAEDVAGKAAEAGLDFLVISDHGLDTCRTAGLTGWRDRLLVMSAPEIGTRGRPHFITFRPDAVGDLAQLEQLEEHEAIDAAARAGAMPFVAHPHPARMWLYKMPPVGWSDLDGRHFAGIEIWSYMHDVCHDVIPWHVFTLARRHQQRVAGPRPETLALWDQLCRTRRVAGIGALDNHATRIPLLGELLPHEDLFRLHRTHVLCDTLPEDGRLAEHRLAEAMAEGRAFVAMDGWGDATGFRVRATEGDLALGLGDEAAFRPGLTLSVVSPLAADLMVVQDGRPVARHEAVRDLEMPLDTPGVYRVEARLDGRPWVFTNPIYLRGGDDPATPPPELRDEEVTA